MKVLCKVGQASRLPRQARSASPPFRDRRDAHPALERGVALVITLIMLAVITFMAIAFLVLSRGQKSNVTNQTDQTLARLAADTAMTKAQLDLLGPIMASGNPFNVGLLVSTNYISFGGFTNSGPTYTSPVNVNYVYPNGTPLTGNDALQNLANLLYSPRAPVFVVTNRITRATDFRFYLDLNRNGQFEPSGLLPVIDDLGRRLRDPVSGLPLISFFSGDPQWVGGLEFPNRPHSANNQFTMRYAYLVAPASETLDINYIHNQAARPDKTAFNLTGGDFLRNQGVGPWEINLAAFLLDLNTNFYAWGPNYVYDPIRGFVTGNSFVNAFSILTNRYGGSLNFLPSVLGQFGAVNQRSFWSDNFDDYTAGPIMTLATGLQPDPDQTRTSRPWPGGYNTNHYFSMQELFDPARTSPDFVTRLQTAGLHTNSYSRYTYYRLLSSLGTDSTPEKGKINLNYVNVDAVGNVVPDMATNFIPWTNAVQFFTNVAARLMEDAGYTVGLGNTNMLRKQAFGPPSVHIPIWPINLYTPSIHRCLQLAANIYDSTTNKTYFRTRGLPPYCPSAFRPIFRREVIAGTNYVFIVGYDEVRDLSLTLDSKNGGVTMIDVEANSSAVPTQAPRGGEPEPMVYGVPVVIGAKQGFPNFNEFSMQTYMYISRLLEFRRGTIDGPVTQTNQMYVCNVTNTFGLEGWNSYSNTYPRDLQLIAVANMKAVITNELGNMVLTNMVTRSVVTNILARGVAPWRGWPIMNLVQNSFVLPFGPNGNFQYLTNSTYINQAPWFEPITRIFPVDGRNNFYVPRWWLNLNTKLRFILVDQQAQRIVDYVNLNNWEKPIDITAKLAEGNTFTGGSPTDWKNPANQWITNRLSGSTLDRVPTYGVINQILVCLNGTSDWNSYSQDPFAGLDAHKAVDSFRYNLKGWSPIYPEDQGLAFYRSNVFYAPFDPYRPVFVHTSWQANDPLVHYTIGDLTDVQADPTGTNRVNFTPQNPALDNIGIINNRYEPWGGNPLGRSTPSIGATDLAAKDPLVTRSDDWSFPTNKYPNIGWLGRVHRGTPWQTIYLKSSNLLFSQGPAGAAKRLSDWQSWTGNPDIIPWIGQMANTNIIVDAALTLPTNDWRILDLFTTAFNDNAARGQMSVNQTNLAAWSAVLSGVNVLTNVLGSTFIQPAGVYVPTSPPPVVRIVSGIINSRTNFANLSYHHVGDVLATPELTVASPYLVGNANLMNDAVYERIPQQILGLLKGGEQPRFVIYAYGQALKPAPRSLVTSGPYFGLCTNYQVTAEVATRAVVRIDGAPNNPHAVIENFNVLPPD